MDLFALNKQDGGIPVAAKNKYNNISLPAPNDGKD